MEDFTNVPNELLDLTGVISGAEFKALMAIWHEASKQGSQPVKLSNPYLERKTGLSDQGLRNAIAALVDRGIIDRTRTPSGTEYTVRGFEV